MHKMQSLISLVVLLPLLAAFPAAAQEPPDWYDIEIIIFKHNTGSGEETEASNHEPEPPDREEAVELAPPPGVSPRPLAVTSPLANPRIPYQRLDDSELRMEPLVARLNASGAYEPLLHLAWQQPVRPSQPVQGVRLHNNLMEEPSDLRLPPDLLSYKIDDRWSEKTPEEDTIEGVVSIERNRFLHLNIDLRYLQPDATGSDAGLFSIFTRNEPRPKVYRLHDRRRIDVEEVHYFDHPAFGVLMLVTPDEIVEKPPQPAADQPQDS